MDYRREPEPTGLGEVRNSERASLDYNMEWAERNSLSIGASYSRSGSTFNSNTQDSDLEYVTVRATLERAFSQRVSGFVSASTNRTYGSGLDIEPNFNIGAGLRIRLGRRS